MGIVITCANQKGGVGKTTTTACLSYILAKDYKKKVLVIDADPQGNLTQMITGENSLLYREKSILEAIKEGDLKPYIQKSSSEYVLDFIPSNVEFSIFSMFLNKEFGLDETRNYIFKSLIKDIKENYDYIFIDIPPTLSDFTNNALSASDYILIVMQTHTFALEAIDTFIPYLLDIKENFNSKLDLIGILPVLMDNKGSIDQFVLESAKEKHKDVVFDVEIKIRERIKSFATLGIQERDFHDTRALEQYREVVKELIKRV